MENVTRINADFAAALYQHLATGTDNIFCSPYSIAETLAMTLAGARKNTARQMIEVLRFSDAAEEIHAAFAETRGQLKQIAKAGEISLALANAIWPQDAYPLEPPFLDRLHRQYGATVTPLDFAGDAAGARTVINDWVATQTHDHIQALIPPGILTALTRLVLTNAIWFKGIWADPFSEAHTREAPFYVTPDHAVTVKMMAREHPLPFAAFDDFQMIEIPYAGARLSMVILLPRKRDGLAAVTRDMDGAKLEQWMGTLAEQPVEIRLPRFRITCATRLDTPLQAMGMTDAFDMDRADFSGMDGGRGGLYIQAALHKAFITVDEAGSEAAAATAVVVGVRSIAPPSIQFRADRPFLFLIREQETGVVLFMGRVMDPTRDGD